MQFPYSLLENYAPLSAAKLKPVISSLASPTSFLVIHLPKMSIYKSHIGIFLKDLVTKAKLSPLTKDKATELISASTELSFKKLQEDALPMTDESLLARMKLGEEAAFAFLMDKYKSAATTYARKKTDRTSADDAVQEAFVKLWNARTSYPLSLPVFTFLTRAIDTLLIDINRKEKAAKRPKIQFSGDLEAVEMEKGAEPVVSSSEVETDEKIKAVWNAIFKIEMPYRAILVFSDLEGLTSEEVGLLMGVSPSTIRSQMVLARKKMKLVYRQ